MRDYSAMSNQQLSSFLRQLRRSRLELTCENGHRACGCSNVRSMDGNAACAIEVQKEIERRRLYALIPACVAFDPAQIKTLADAQYILQHEIDLAEEGEDGALSGKDLAAVRKAFTEVRNLR